MTQTMKNVNVPPSKPGRPGQRQQERIMRAARRRRRMTILISSIAAAVIVVGAIALLIVDAHYQAQVAAQNDAHATATAAAELKQANAKATASAVSATATATSVNNAGAQLVKDLEKQYPSGPAKPPVLTQTPQSIGSQGLKYITVKQGNGPAIKSGDTIVVEYTGWIEASGKKFDSSYDRSAEPITVTLTQGQIIDGWVQGVPGMKIGETRRLIIPPSLGYGSQDVKDDSGKVVIPANSTLIFDLTPVGYGTPDSTDTSAG